METCNVVAVAGPIVVAVLGLLFAVYCYVRPKERARLVYRTCQLADFGVTREFLSELDICPILIKLRSIGDSAATNVNVTVKVSAPILSHKVTNNLKYTGKVDGDTYSLEIDTMNSDTELSILLKCEATVCRRVLLPGDIRVNFKEGRAKCIND